MFPTAVAIFLSGYGANGAWGAGDAASPAAPPPVSIAGAVKALNPPPPSGPPESIDGYLKIGFDRLGSFPFFGSDSTASAAVSEARIPPAVKKLDGKKVIVTGFLLPIKMDGKDELTTEFLLLRTQMLCCYGIAPQANEWILVEMPQGARPIMDVPTSFRGTLHVHAMFEGGYLTGIYSLDSEKKVNDGG